MPLAIIEFMDLHILHWLITVILPLVLLVVSLVYLVLNRIAAKKLRRPVKILAGEIDRLAKRDMANVDPIEKLVQKTGIAGIRENFSLMKADSDNLYEGRWLPDPARYLNIARLLPKGQVNSLSLRPASRILASGIFGSLISILLQAKVPLPADLHPVTMALPPLLIALACSLLTGAEALRADRLIRSSLDDLKFSLEKKLPVYNDQAGLALAIDRFLGYDRKMAESLADFNATASRLAESDMAEGIRHSVEQVLLDGVAPSINLATATLTDLAENIENRQAAGMQELASQFAAALSADMASHLRPVNKEISQMTALMADVKNYIEYAMRSLETVREESSTLLEDTRLALTRMADARAELSADFGKADQKLAVLAETTASLAALQQGNEQGLSASLDNLSTNLRQHSEEIGKMVADAVRETEQARRIAASQESSADQYLKSMQEQVDKLNSGLQDNIEKMLSRISRESSALTEQSASMGQQLERLNDTLAHSLGEFSQESTKYVQSTLTEFDKNLAELVRRMTQATTEIRDAVDALPAILSNPPKFDS